MEARIIMAGVLYAYVYAIVYEERRTFTRIMALVGSQALVSVSPVTNDPELTVMTIGYGVAQAEASEFAARTVSASLRTRPVKTIVLSRIHRCIRFVLPDVVSAVREDSTIRERLFNEKYCARRSATNHF